MEESYLNQLIANPFLRGLLIGLLIAAFAWFKGFFKVRGLNAEVKKLREHLHTKLEIDSEENERRKKEIEQIKQERDNLRNTVQLLNQKPGRQELRQSNIYQRAVDIMFEKAPGFAPAWQITLKEAEEDMLRTEKGIIPFFKRMKTSTAVGSGETDKARKKALELEEPTN
jgi:hypothetical protein